MHLGFFLPTSSGDASLRSASGLRGFAAEAEGLGFTSLWSVDHVMGTAGHAIYSDLEWLDPLLALSAVAAGTTVPLGTIYCGILRHPVLAAKQLATLMALAPERVVLGLTSGWAVREHEALGFDPATKAARADEWLTVVMRLLTERDVSHEGPTWSFTGVTIEPRPPALPEVWQTGGSGRYGASAGGQMPRRLLDRFVAADGWCVSAMSSAEKAASDRAQIEGRRAAAGVEDELAVSHVNYVHLVETGDAEEALAVQRPLWATSASDADFRDLSDAVLLTGTVDEVVEKLARRAGAGIRTVLLQPFPGHEEAQLRLCAKHLVPAVTDLS